MMNMIKNILSISVRVFAESRFDLLIPSNFFMAKLLRFNITIPHIAFIVFLTSGVANAIDLSLHGFVQGNYSLNTTASNPDGGDLKWGEERAQIKLEINSELFRVFSKTDLFYDHIDEEADADFREAYIDYVSTYFDIRAGRQIITWGLGDLIFINDVFPKDYEAFFSGRPLEYLKKGVDGIKIGVYPDFASFEVVVIPFFEPNRFPSAKRFRMFDPFRVGTEREKEEPATTLDNTELALRIYRDIAGIDTSLYFYRGFFKQPSMPDDPLRLTLFFPELSVYGASFQRRAFDGVLSFETGYYDSREDRDGTDLLMPNSSVRFLAGYQRQMWEDFTIGLQYFGDYMLDHSEYVKTLPQGFPKKKELEDLFTVRLTQLLMHQTLKLSYFSFWSLSDGDYLINPEVRYSFTDNIWAAVGALVFGGGKEWNQFGQFDKNDNVYLQVRYEF